MSYSADAPPPPPIPETARIDHRGDVGADNDDDTGWGFWETPAALPEGDRALDLLLANNPEIRDALMRRARPEEQPTHAYQDGATADITADAAPPSHPAVAERGWRSWIVRYLHIPLRKGAGETHADLISDAEDVIATPLPEPLVIGVSSFRGSVGKTPTTVILARLFAAKRRQQVVVLDTDLYGTLLSRAVSGGAVHGAGTMSMLDARTPTDGVIATLDPYLHDAGDGVYVIPGNTDGRPSTLSPHGYRAILDAATADFPVVLVDMSRVEETDLFDAVLASLDALVMITPPHAESIRFLDNIPMLLKKHQAEHLRHTRITLFNNIKREPRRTAPDTEALADALKLRDSTEVAEEPFDSHIAADTVIDWSSLGSVTRDYMTLAAAALMHAIITDSAGQDRDAPTNDGEQPPSFDLHTPEHEDLHQSSREQTQNTEPERPHPGDSPDAPHNHPPVATPYPSSDVHGRATAAPPGPPSTDVTHAPAPAEWASPAHTAGDLPTDRPWRSPTTAARWRESPPAPWEL